MPGAANHFYWRIIVQGAGAFPLDMLRYDRCWPATSTDVAHIIRSLRRPALPDQPLISLICVGSKAHSGLNPDRWRSFDWQIVSQVRQLMLS